MSQLQRLRRSVGLTQRELADLAGVKLSSIQKQERGGYVDTALSLAAPIAQALQVPIEALFLPEVTDKCIKSLPQLPAPFPVPNFPELLDQAITRLGRAEDAALVDQLRQAAAALRASQSSPP